MTKIFLAASMNFYPKLLEIEAKLKAIGFDVEIPVSAKIMRENRDFEVAHFKGFYSNEQKQTFFRENLSNIEKSDAILVVNEEKNGISGYIGTSVIMEIGIAFYLHKIIYLWNELPAEATYKPEIDAFEAFVINQDLEKIHV
jgi:nucleoside 2-deoxyribosyltransferase